MAKMLLVRLSNRLVEVVDKESLRVSNARNLGVMQELPVAKKSRRRKPSEACTLTHFPLFPELQEFLSLHLHDRNRMSGIQS